MSALVPEQHETQEVIAAPASKRKFEDLGGGGGDPSNVPSAVGGNGGNNNNNADASSSSGSRWYPSAIIIEARTFDGTPVNADLMTVIGRGVKANKCTLSERYYLPSQYNQNNAEYRAKTIAPIFASACACAGCEVRLKGWEKSKGFLKFVCPQYRRYKSTSKQQQQQLQQQQQQQRLVEPSAAGDGASVLGSPALDVANRSTNSLEDVAVPPPPPVLEVVNNNKKTRTSTRAISRPLDKESTCPFSFLVFWEEYTGQDGIAVDARKGRWFVCATGAGTPYHEGHARKEFSEGELRRKQLQVEGAHDILMPYYKQVVELVDRDEDKLNQAIGRLNGLIDGLKRQQQHQQQQQQNQNQQQNNNHNNSNGGTTAQNQNGNNNTHHNQHLTMGKMALAFESHPDLQQPVEVPMPVAAEAQQHVAMDQAVAAQMHHHQQQQQQQAMVEVMNHQPPEETQQHHHHQHMELQQAQQQHHQAMMEVQQQQQQSEELHHHHHHHHPDMQPVVNEQPVPMKPELMDDPQPDVVVQPNGHAPTDQHPVDTAAAAILDQAVLNEEVVTL